MYPDTFIPPAIPAAIQAYKLYGVSKSKATYLIQNVWTIPTHQHDILATYYLLNWDVSYFREKLQEGVIEREGVTYQVIYHRTDPIAIEKATGKLFISFRKLQAEYGVMPTALVALVSNKREGA